MKVSIIIPVYNVEKYLEESINSATNQTLEDIEIICVNDGSTDSSLEILEKYKEMYENIVLVSQENKGVGAARNTGLKFAKGEYVYFLDSDDYIDLNSMEVCYNECKKYDLDMVTFDAECFYDKDYNGVAINESYNRSKLKHLSVIEGREFYIKSNNSNIYMAPVWLNFYKHEFIKQNNLFFEENMLHEDEIHTCDSLLAAKKVKYIDYKFFKRRFRSNSIMTSKMSVDRIYGNIKILKHLYELYEKYNIEDEELKDLLKQKINMFLNGIIRYCDALNEYKIKNEVIEFVKDKKGILDLKSDLVINAPMLSYNAQNISKNRKQEFEFYKYENKIYYMLIPEHGNLGDQGIVYATLKFLEDNYPKHKIIKINYNETSLYIEEIKKTFKMGDFIVLHGGGNIGNHYIWEEQARRYIIDSLNTFPIVSFTQTIYFSKDEQGQKEFENTKSIYNKNSNLTLFAREERSYEIMKNSFYNNNVYICPDIVFYLNNKLNCKYKNIDRNQIMTCFRKDKESYYKLEDKASILSELAKEYSLFENDTIINYRVSHLERDDELEKLWNEFYKSKVVITDRLHGMIFAAITKTPCIVLRSLDYKVTESYKWIESLNYIKIVDDLNVDHIRELVKELYKIENINDIDFDKKYFKDMAENINEVIEK